MKCIILQVLRGLQYLHEKYIIHRWERGERRGGEGGPLGGSLQSPRTAGPFLSSCAPAAGAGSAVWRNWVGAWGKH